MNIGTTVITPNGHGTIADVEYYNRLHGGMKRFGIELADSPFSFSPAYYFEDEVSVDFGD